MTLTWANCKKTLTDLGFGYRLSENSGNMRFVAEAVNRACGDYEHAENREDRLPVEMATMVVAMVLVSHGWPT